MIDVLSAALHAVAVRGALAYPLVFAAGAATGAGPCAAPRYIALAALATASRRPALTALSFGAGLAGAYVVLGCATGALASIATPRASSLAYLALAVALGAGGVAVLARRPRPCLHDPRASNVHASPAGFGGAFLLGAGGVIVASPCCTPVVAALAGLRGGTDLASAAPLIAAFACGHALPLVIAGALRSRVPALPPRFAVAGASSLASGTLMLALAAYYGILA